MFKILFLIFLIYVSFRVFSTKRIEGNQTDSIDGKDPEEFTDYEEIED
jgi:hypothetical protein